MGYYNIKPDPSKLTKKELKSIERNLDELEEKEVNFNRQAMKKKMIIERIKEKKQMERLKKTKPDPEEQYVY
ncbi:MAG: hypothetical protein ACLFUH_09815 [Bacteroidales bacterium]